MTELSPLVDQVRTSVAWAVDTSEVAALLESSGVNDRVADHRYGYPTVFALARDVRSSLPPAPVAAVSPSPWPRRPMVRDTLVRAALYLTPTVVAVGFAPRLGQLPWYATIGLLIAGWGGAQALAWLGYGVASAIGPAAAARPLGVGFLAFALSWCGLLAMLGADPRAYLVCAAQLAMFGANTAALVTGAERRTALAALGSWLAVAALTAGLPGVAFALLAASLCAMVVVAYLPALRKGNTWYWPGLGRYPKAVRHGMVGAGQGALFVVVVLHRISTMSVPVSALLLLAGVPLAELTVLWHQWRVAEGRRLLANRDAFAWHLRNIGMGTTLCLALPLIVTAWPGAMVVLGRWPGSAGVCESVLLAGFNALCLVFVAHRRPLTAAVLVWWPVALLTATLCAPHGLMPALPPGHVLADRLTTATLLCAYPPALTLAAMALRDPWSYQ